MALIDEQLIADLKTVPNFPQDILDLLSSNTEPVAENTIGQCRTKLVNLLSPPCPGNDLDEQDRPKVYNALKALVEKYPNNVVDHKYYEDPLSIEENLPINDERRESWIPLSDGKIYPLINLIKGVISKRKFIIPSINLDMLPEEISFIREKVQSYLDNEERPEYLDELSDHMIKDFLAVSSGNNSAESAGIERDEEYNGYLSQYGRRERQERKEFDVEEFDRYHRHNHLLFFYEGLCFTINRDIPEGWSTLYFSGDLFNDRNTTVFNACNFSSATFGRSAELGNVEFHECDFSQVTFEDGFILYDVKFVSCTFGVTQIQSLHSRGYLGKISENINVSLEDFIILIESGVPLTLEDAPNSESLRVQLDNNHNQPQLTTEQFNRLKNAGYTDFKHFDLSRVEFDNVEAVNFQGCSFNRTQIGLFYSNGIRQFCGISARGVDLSGMDLTGANFEKADLSEANLDDAIVNDVNFSSACFNGARLAPQSCNNTNFNDAKVNEATKFTCSGGDGNENLWDRFQRSHDSMPIKRFSSWSGTFFKSVSSLVGKRAHQRFQSEHQESVSDRLLKVLAHIAQNPEGRTSQAFMGFARRGQVYGEDTPASVEMLRPSARSDS